MARRDDRLRRFLPSATTTIAGTMVVAGFLLCGVSWWFLMLTAAGACGPGILRELGLLQDRDEVQQAAARRAGYVAFLVTGIVAFAVEAFLRTGGHLTDLSSTTTLLLAVLWFTWLLGVLLAYWGVRKGVSRMLFGFGVVWLAFAIVTNVGAEWTGWTALLLTPLITLPFFVLGMTAMRWPRTTGCLLLVAALGFFAFFGGLRGDIDALVRGAVTLVLFVGPLLGGGVALLASAREPDDLDTVPAAAAT